MNRAWWVPVSTVLAGVAIGVGSSWYQYAGDQGFGFSKPLATPDGQGVASMTSDPGVPAGRARVYVEGDGVYDFGVMSKGETRSHTFVVENTGTIPLQLRFVEKSCQCTDVQMSGSNVPPGESVEIELSWQPNDYKLEFSQTARFVTNDPAQLELDLTVTGRVQQIVRPVPIALSFDNVLADQQRDLPIHVFGYRDDDLRVERVDFLRAASAEYFQARVEPLPGDVLEREPGARSGSLVVVSLLPGVPLGSFHQQIRLHLNQDDLAPIEIPVEGAIVGNVTVVGPDFDARSGVLQLGTLSGDQPVERRLWVLVKGDQTNAGSLRVRETDPSAVLEASLGESIRVGNLMRQSLTIRIVPHGRLVNRLGSQQGDLGRIVLESDPVSDCRVIVYVSFALEGSP